jgi:hypothetical protein
MEMSNKKNGEFDHPKTIQKLGNHRKAWDLRLQFTQATK